MTSWLWCAPGCYCGLINSFCWIDMYKHVLPFSSIFLSCSITFPLASGSGLVHVWPPQARGVSRSGHHVPSWNPLEAKKGGPVHLTNPWEKSQTRTDSEFSWFKMIKIARWFKHIAHSTYLRSTIIAITYQNLSTYHIAIFIHKMYELFPCYYSCSGF